MFAENAPHSIPARATLDVPFETTRNPSPPQQPLEIIQLLGRALGLAEAAAQLVLHAAGAHRRRQAERIAVGAGVLAALASCRAAQRIGALAGAHAGAAPGAAGSALALFAFALHA